MRAFAVISLSASLVALSANSAPITGSEQARLKAALAAGADGRAKDEARAIAQGNGRVSPMELAGLPGQARQ